MDRSRPQLPPRRMSSGPPVALADEAIPASTSRPAPPRKAAPQPPGGVSPPAGALDASPVVDKRPSSPTSRVTIAAGSLAGEEAARRPSSPTPSRAADDDATSPRLARTSDEPKKLFSLRRKNSRSFVSSKELPLAKTPATLRPTSPTVVVAPKALARPVAKLWRRVPMGPAHHGFVAMLTHLLCDRGALCARALAQQQVVHIGGKEVLCLEPPSDALLVAWMQELASTAPSLLPRGLDHKSEAALAVARAAWDALVVRAAQCATYPWDELDDALSVDELRAVCAKLLTAEESLRLPGSGSRVWPRDRFNPFTHSPAETVAHQRKSLDLSRFRIPYVVSVLTWMLLRTHGLEAEGLFRLSPDSTAVDEVRRALVTENWDDITDRDDPHIFAAMLKNYFATLAVPLFPDASIILRLCADGACDWSAAVSAVLLPLPAANLALVWWWVSLCRVLMAYEHANAMGAKQLVTCWAPCLIRQEMDMATMARDTEAISAFLQCLLVHHPAHHPVGEAVVGMRCVVDGQVLHIQSYSFRSRLFFLSNSDFASFEELVIAPEVNNVHFPLAPEAFFATLVRPKSSSTEDYYDLEERVGRYVLSDVEHWVQLVDAIPFAGISEMMDSVYPYLCRRDLFLPLLTTLVEREVEATKALNTLFRQNSRATKLIKAFLASEGARFLKTAIHPLIRDICRQNADLTTSPAASAEENRAKVFGLSEVTAMTLCTIINHMCDVPPSMRAVAALLSDTVTAKFASKFAPEQNTADECMLVAAGGFFFLRFVSPAFVTASSSAPSHAAFTLKQIAKMLQAIVASSQLRDEEWPDFELTHITVHMPKLMRFLEELAQAPGQLEGLSAAPTEDEAVASFCAVVSLVRQHIARDHPTFGALHPH